ncbi:MAG TPA: MATE family efflux transporter [Balneolaceae bacterium]|nr:MATE family efflux transporter [Balneolaceae bacterium]
MNRRILRLAIPNVISNLSVPVLGAVDTALLGHLHNVAYIGAISVAGILFDFIFWGFGFLRMGTTGLTAQAYGEDNKTQSVATLGRALMVAGLFSLLIIAAQVGIADLGFALIGASADVEHYARIYFYIRIYSAPATLGLYAINGWFLGMQNARYPMIITVAFNLLNIALDVWFVYGLHMNVPGVALGTLISRYAGLFLAAALGWFKYKSWLQAFVASLIAELEPLKKFFTVNLDIFVRTLCLIFAFTFFTAKSASMGDTILAANTILLQLWMVVSYGIDGFANAAESLVGRYTGSQQRRKLNQTIKYCFIWGVNIGVAASIIYGLFDKTILHIFTNQEPVIHKALLVFGWTIAGPTVSSFCYIWDGIFIGATATEPMRNSMIIATVGVFLPAYFIGKPYLGIQAIWLALTLFMIARGLTLSLFAPKHIFKSS